MSLGALKKKAAAEVFRTQQFLKFRFSKGTNAELNLRSTLQQSVGLVVSKVVVPFLEDQFHFIEIYKTECWFHKPFLQNGFAGPFQ